MLALQQREISPEYISGYVDGEGCFTISFSKRPKLLIGWETKPSFSVSQNQDRAEVLHRMQTYFGAGFIRRDYSDKTLKYEVRSLNDLLEKIIPHFEAYPLLSGKHNDFLFFRDVCFLMKDGAHHTSDGLSRILALAFQMNASGKRRYTKEDILSSLFVADEDIVRTIRNNGII